MKYITPPLRFPLAPPKNGSLQNWEVAFCSAHGEGGRGSSPHPLGGSHGFHCPATCLLFLFLTASILLSACGAAGTPGPPASPNPGDLPAEPLPSPVPTETAYTAPPRTRPTAVLGAPARPTATLRAPRFDCSADGMTAALLEQLTPETWLAWVERLSGAQPVEIGGEQVTITSRYTPAMFPASGRPLPNARAFEYVEETLRGWYPPEQIEVQEWQSATRAGVLRGKNLILSLPGAEAPGEVVILSAHLDSRAHSASELLAPGAEDNASGAAALLEAARLLRGTQASRTIRIIWFTGEEQGMLGSKAYADALEDPSSVAGVVNLDMFGYDPDGDRCYEMHAGTLDASAAVGECFAESARAYGQGLETFDLLTERATAASDHGSFWQAGIGAVEILENKFDNRQPGGCLNAEPNPNYHSTGDTADLLNAETGARIARTALAAVIAMAR